MKRHMLTNIRRLGRGGFTLVELMIVVAIIAILATFLAPSVATFMRRSQGKTAARNVANTFRMAHNQAMSRGEVILAEITLHNQANQDGDTVAGGRIELFRTVNNSLARCNPTNAEYDPADSDCYAMSCAQAQGFQRESVRDFVLSEATPDMIISAMDPAATTRTVCFSPNGRVLDMSGLPIESGSSACDATNLRVFVRSLESEDPLGDVPLAECVGAVDADGSINTSALADREEQQIDRELNNFYSIHVPYNGAVTVTQ